MLTPLPPIKTGLHEGITSGRYRILQSARRVKRRAAPPPPFQTHPRFRTATAAREKWPPPPLPSVSPRPRTALTRRRHALSPQPIFLYEAQKGHGHPAYQARPEADGAAAGRALFRDVAPLGSPRNWRGKRRRRRLYHHHRAPLSLCFPFFPMKLRGLHWFGIRTGSSEIGSVWRDPYNIFSTRQKEIWLGKGGRIRTECLCLNLSPDVAKL